MSWRNTLLLDVTVAIILLLSLTNGAPQKPRGKRIVTAMEEVVKANKKHGSLNNGTDDVLDDVILPPLMSSAGSQEYSGSMRRRRKLWPNGRIVYKMSRDITRRPNHMRMIKAAMAEWERHTCLRFVNKTNGPSVLQYVYIYYGIGCRASVGRWSRKSLLTLGKWCDNFKVVLHELGHTIGFYHEQSRPDRDRYVQVLWENIERQWYYAFSKKKSKHINSLGLPYDPNSIMHYGTHLFSKNGKPTLKSRDPSIKYLGNTGLSLMDIKQTNMLYNCVYYPEFPEDFYFTKGRSQVSPHCITMNEPIDRLWNDLTICYKKDKRNINFRWSNSGPIPSMTCTNTPMSNRRSYARYWKDNYICVPRDSVLRFGWSASGPITGMKCTGIRVHPGSSYLYHLCAKRIHRTTSNQGSKFTSWSPWHRCTRECGGGVQTRTRQCKRGRVCREGLLETRFCNNHKCSSWPHWPADFKYIVGFTQPIHSCARVFERNQYSQWLKNWFCWKIMRRRSLKILWSDMDRVPGMRCTQITEPRERRDSGWDNNFLCVQQDAPYRFQWSSNGPIRGKQCVRWKGKNGRDGWYNNYLCADEFPEKTGCPKGWIARRTRSHDFCYLLDSKARTWPEAQNVCGTRRANLLSIRSKEEYKFIKDNVQKGMSVWIGANDRSREGVWQWLDRSRVRFSNWDSGEPNNGGSKKNEHCGLLRYDGKWNDFPCEQYPFHYICKKVVPRR